MTSFLALTRAVVLHSFCCLPDEVRKERAKETKHDTTIELAALLHEVSHACRVFGTVALACQPVTTAPFNDGITL
mgnify:CR=1 FL=1|jgi:hypothetical protein